MLNYTSLYSEELGCAFIEHPNKGSPMLAAVTAHRQGSSCATLFKTLAYTVLHYSTLYFTTPLHFTETTLL